MNSPTTNAPLDPGSARDELFVSYAVEDASFVRWFAAKLALCGYRVWWDQTHDDGGQLGCADEIRYAGRRGRRSDATRALHGSVAALEADVRPSSGARGRLARNTGVGVLQKAD